MSLDERPPHDANTDKADLLLVLPVCLARDSGELLFESQACNGMERWLENFPRVTAICPLLSDKEFQNAHSTVWKPVSGIANADRLRFVPLPSAMTLASFARAYSGGAALIRSAIHQSRYLCFAIGGLFGDWGAVACLEARKLNRPYAVWTDRVEHKVHISSGSFRRPLDRLKQQVRSKLMYLLERRCIGRAVEIGFGNVGKFS